MLQTITPLSLFLDITLIEKIIFNDRLREVYFRYFSVLYRVVCCLLIRLYIIKYLINISVV
ncbi:hypothetical protein FDF36_00015 [Bacteroides fragilis]|nr:hypothetical protein [Bacteroides fragilis]